MSKMRMPLLIAGAFIAGVVGTYLVTAPERVTAENSIATALAIGTSVTPDVCVAKARRQALVGDFFRGPTERVSYRRAAEESCVKKLTREFATNSP